MKGFKNAGKIQGIVTTEPFQKGPGKPVEFTVKEISEKDGASGKEYGKTFFEFSVFGGKAKAKALSTLTLGCRANLSFKVGTRPRVTSNGTFYSMYLILTDCSVDEAGVEKFTDFEYKGSKGRKVYPVGQPEENEPKREAKEQVSQPSSTNSWEDIPF